MTSSETYFSDEVCCIAFWNNVVLIDVDGEMSAMRMRMVARSYGELLTKYPRIASIVVMRPGNPVASSAARAEATRFMKEYSASLVHVSVVIEAQGIVAQMLRSVIRGINVITRNTNMTIEADVESAIRMVVPAVITTAPPDHIASELSAALA